MKTQATWIAVLCVFVGVSTSLLGESSVPSRDEILRRYPRLYPGHYGVRYYHSWQDPNAGPFLLGNKREATGNYLSEWYHAELQKGTIPGPSATPLPRTRSQKEVYLEALEFYNRNGGRQTDRRLTPADRLGPTPQYRHPSQYPQSRIYEGSSQSRGGRSGQYSQSTRSYHQGSGGGRSVGRAADPRGAAVTVGRVQITNNSDEGVVFWVGKTERDLNPDVTDGQILEPNQVVTLVLRGDSVISFGRKRYRLRPNNEYRFEETRDGVDLERNVGAQMYPRAEDR